MASPHSYIVLHATLVVLHAASVLVQGASTGEQMNSAAAHVNTRKWSGNAPTSLPETPHKIVRRETRTRHRHRLLSPNAFVIGDGDGSPNCVLPALNDSPKLPGHLANVETPSGVLTPATPTLPRLEAADITPLASSHLTLPDDTNLRANKPAVLSWETKPGRTSSSQGVIGQFDSAGALHHRPSSDLRPATPQEEPKPEQGMKIVPGSGGFVPSDWAFYKRRGNATYLPGCNFRPTNTQSESKSVLSVDNALPPTLSKWKSPTVQGNRDYSLGLKPFMSSLWGNARLVTGQITTAPSTNNEAGSVASE